MLSRVITSVIFALLAGAAAVSAQDPTPSPTPTAVPQALDRQQVAPEQLQGVPAIAPGYSSEDRSLPDLGRVGVDMADQKSLTLREAIA